ncbi:MAG: DUF2878 domain-containing protein [Xanthomonadales bacterium]|jgi:hypothetical protein|nr:DUF2878 domain-containing protein [Xanthomonadales bacterium]
MNAVINFAAFQFGWFATVLGTANGMPWLGPLTVLGVVALHLRRARRPAVEARLLMIALLLGTAVDSLVLAGGWISYPNGAWLPGFAPYWIITLWALFATTLNLSLGWMKQRYVLAAAFGAIGGPLSYLAGAKLGAMSFIATVPAAMALALAWSLAMPLLVYIASRLDGVSAIRKPPYIHEQWSLDGRG